MGVWLVGWNVAREGNCVQMDRQRIGEEGGEEGGKEFERSFCDVFWNGSKGFARENGDSSRLMSSYQAITWNPPSPRYLTRSERQEEQQTEERSDHQVHSGW